MWITSINWEGYEWKRFLFLNRIQNNWVIQKYFCLIDGKNLFAHVKHFEFRIATADVDCFVTKSHKSKVYVSNQCSVQILV